MPDQSSLYLKLKAVYMRCGFSPLVSDDLAERGAEAALAWFEAQQDPDVRTD